MGQRRSSSTRLVDREGVHPYLNPPPTTCMRLSVPFSCRGRVVRINTHSSPIISREEHAEKRPKNLSLVCYANVQLEVFSDAEMRHGDPAGELTMFPKTPHRGYHLLISYLTHLLLDAMTFALSPHDD